MTAGLSSRKAIPSLERWGFYYRKSIQSMGFGRLLELVSIGIAIASEADLLLIGAILIGVAIHPDALCFFIHP
jgi:hypothetical protein